MRHNTLKLMALTSAIALSFAFTNNSLAETETVATTLTTNSAITLASGDTLDFGTWAVIHGGTTDVTLTMNPLTGAVAQTGNGSSGSVAIEITAGLQSGSITVATPAAATLDIFGSITDAIVSDAALTLGSPTFSFDGGAVTALPPSSGSATITTIGGGTAETIRIGGQVVATATPADATHAGEITVEITY